jgi:tetratricopeptide (TPR) repeat protein
MILTLAASLAYSNCLNAPFIFDDISSIETSPAIRSLWPLSQVVANSNRPILNLTLAVNYAVGGLDVRGYHLVNVVVHLLAGLTLFALVRQTLRLRGIASRFQESADLIAFSVSLIWLVHPLQTQAVTYIVQRGESLMGLFFLLVLYCTVRGALSPKPNGWYLSAVLCSWLGMGTKEVMIVAPLVMLVYDRTFLSDSWKTAFQQRWPVYLMGALAQVALLVLISALLAEQAAPSAGFDVRGLTAWEYLRSQPGVILHYLRLAIWPDKLCLDYLWPVASNPLEIYGLGLMILSLFVGSLVLLRWWPRIAFTGITFFLVLAPTSSFLPILDLAVEHRMYLALIPVIALVVLALFSLISRVLKTESQQRSAFVAIVLMVATELTVRTRHRNEDYASRVSMWSDVVTQAPHNYRGHFCLGLALQEQNRLEEAATELQRSIELNPGYAKGHQSLAMIKAAQGDMAEAISHYQHAIRFSTGFVLAYRNYGNLLARQNNYEQALEQYTRAAEIQPTDASTYRVIGHTQLKLGRYTEAADAFQTAVTLRSDSVPDLAWLAWLRATAPDAKDRDGTFAVKLANQAVNATGYKDVAALNILAAAYAETGQFTDAAATARRAQALAAALGDDALVTKTEQRIDKFRAHTPLRQSPELFIEP